MTRYFIILILLGLLISTLFIACSNPISSHNESSKDPTEEYEFITIGLDGTTSFSDEAIKYPEIIEFEPSCYGGLAYYIPHFFALEEFYTFAMTGTRDITLYSSSHVQEYIEIYPSVDPCALVKIEDMFPTKSFLNDFASVVITAPNSYVYVFRSGVKVYIDYDQNRYPTEVGVVNDINSRYIGNGGIFKLQYTPLTDEYRFDLSNTKKIFYLNEIDGIPFVRMIMDEACVLFMACIDGFRIVVDVDCYEPYEFCQQLFEDPKNHQIAAFFDDSRLNNAVLRLKSAIVKEIGG